MFGSIRRALSWVVATAVLGVVTAGCGMLTTEAPRDQAGQVTADAEAGVTKLRLGDCISDVASLNEEVSTVPVTPCDSPHQGEVFAELELTDPNLPGDAATQADDFCMGEIIGFLGGEPTGDYADLGLLSLYPTSTSWALGDRMIQCIVADETGGLTGSLKGVLG